MRWALSRASGPCHYGSVPALLIPATGSSNGPNLIHFSPSVLNMECREKTTVEFRFEAPQMGKFKWTSVHSGIHSTKLIIPYTFFDRGQHFHHQSQLCKFLNFQHHEVFCSKEQRRAGTRCYIHLRIEMAFLLNFHGIIFTLKL